MKPGPGSVQEKLDELRAFAISRLDRLRDVLADPQSIHEARALPAERMSKFSLARISKNGEASFKHNGEIDFFGDEAFTQLTGAGERNWTESLPVRFVWLAAA